MNGSRGETVNEEATSNLNFVVEHCVFVFRGLGSDNDLPLGGDVYPVAFLFFVETDHYSDKWLVVDFLPVLVWTENESEGAEDPNVWYVWLYPVEDFKGSFQFSFDGTQLSM